ncbi:MAG TPA: Uma2 family endonuclease [Tepidisphaeraceae bacterium]|nr:Uma2 family endonuclease [Tepidisphaeraceae bacterium]
MSTKTLISIAEFDRLEPPVELRYELDEGELLEMVKPRYQPHNRIVMKITGALLAYLGKNPIGEVLTSDNLFVLGPNTKRIPDLSFMTTDRVRQIQPDKDIEGAPDLAIEVLSPSDTVTAMRRKVKQYFAAGSRAVWLVYPESREIEIRNTAAGPSRVLSENDTIEAPELLPGFSAKVASFF